MTVVHAWRDEFVMRDKINQYLIYSVPANHISWLKCIAPFYGKHPVLQVSQTNPSIFVFTAVYGYNVTAENMFDTVQKHTGGHITLDWLLYGRLAGG